MITKETQIVFERILQEKPNLIGHLLYPITNYIGRSSPFRVMSRYGEVYIVEEQLERNKGVSRKAAVNKTEYFINESKAIHKDTYTYEKTNFKGIRKKVTLTCKKHGDFDTYAGNHLRGGGCKKCAWNMQTQAEFIKKLKAVQGNKYSYKKTLFTKQVDRIIMTCKYHGDFSVVAFNALNGCGCLECNKRDGWYDLKTAKEKKQEWKNKSATLYLLRMSDGTEEFDKIGITVNTVKKRYESSLPYKYKILWELNTNLYNACLLESKIKRDYFLKRYIPSKKFGGMFECFEKGIIILNTHE